MHPTKITLNLLFEYQCTSGKFITMPNRIEKNRFGSEDRIETSFARIGMLYTAGTCGSPIVVVTMATIQSTCSRRHVTSQARTPVTTTARGHLPRLDDPAPRTDNHIHDITHSSLPGAPTGFFFQGRAIGGGIGQRLGGTMASAEHEPITEVWGQSP